MTASKKTACSPVEITLDVVGGKWKPLIIYFLLRQDIMRFNEIQRAIPAATRRMITKHLRELEEHGIVHREVYAEVPPRVEYSLTPLGHTLTPVLNAISAWGLEYIAQDPNIELRTPDDMSAQSMDIDSY
ncbi:MAG: helix-turn-helix domain-containing protein [Phototrophicaceae bacterium]